MSILTILHRKKRTRRLAWAVYLDSSSRFGFQNPRGSINFIEFINNCFPYTEALRKSLRELDASCAFSAEEADFINKVLDLIFEITAFLDKWSASYTGWLSSFKSKSQQAKNIVFNSNEFVYEEFQSFYRNGEQLYEDISELLLKIKELTRSCEVQLNLKEYR